MTIARVDNSAQQQQQMRLREGKSHLDASCSVRVHARALLLACDPIAFVRVTVGVRVPARGTSERTLRQTSEC